MTVYLVEFCDNGNNPFQVSCVCETEEKAQSELDIMKAELALHRATNKEPTPVGYEEWRITEWAVLQ